MDMAVLVESQGELLNQIEHNVEQAVGYVAQGVDELNKVRARYEANETQNEHKCGVVYR
jgi:t-SNARE complex subunit (syntaxin)